MLDAPEATPLHDRSHRRPDRSSSSRRRFLRFGKAFAVSSVIALLAVLGAVSPAGSAAAAGTGPTAADVTTAHPRLELDQQSVVDLRASVSSDPAVTAVWNRVRAEADRMLTEPVLKRSSPDGIRILETSQTLVQRARTLGISYLVTGSPAYADRLWLDLDAASKFADWNPDHFLDTAEMTQGMAIGYDWLYARWTPSQRSTLSSAIQRLGLQPSVPVYSAPANTSGPYAHGGNWAVVTNNWNIVANGGMIAGAVATAQDNAGLSDRILGYATPSLRRGLAQFGPDGGYAEGPTYWEYATRYLASALSTLDVATGTDWGLAASPGVSTTGYFPVQMLGASKEMYDFGDSDSTQLNPPSQLYLAKKFDNADFLSVGGKQTGSDAQRLIWYQAATTAAAGPGASRDSFSAAAGVSTMRSSWDADGTSVGFRSASSPTSGHQHQDSGSFILDALGERWSSDLGRDDYSLAGYFEGESRWTYYRNRQEAHSTLLVDPFRSSTAYATGRSTMVRSDANASSSLAVSDLSALLPGGTTWQRGVKLFDGRDQFLVQDEVERYGPVEALWSMNTEALIDVSDDGRSATLYRDGQRMLARIVTDDSFRFSVMDAAPLATSPRPAGQSSNLADRKLTIAASGTDSVRIAVQFSPLHGDAPVAAAAPVVGLSSWSLDAVGTSRATGVTVGGTPLPSFAGDDVAYTAAVDPTGPVPVVAAQAAAGSVVTSTSPAAVPGWASTTITEPGRTPTTYRVLLTPGPIRIESAVASRTTAGSPEVTFDGTEGTYWSTWGDNSITWQLARATAVERLDLSWVANSSRLSKFDLLSSPDGRTWTARTSGSYLGTGGWASVAAAMPSDSRFVRLVGHGDGTKDVWTALREVRIYSFTEDAHVHVPDKSLSFATAAISASEVQAGATAAASATGTGPDGRTLPASSVRLTWGSSDPAVASVDRSGSVTGRTAGTAMIGVLVESGGVIRSASVPVTVVDRTKVRLYPTADSYVQGGASAGTNYGAITGMLVKTSASTTTDQSYTRVGYLRFDLSALQGRTVTGATLTTTAAITDNGSPVLLDFHDTPTTWTEKGLTFTNRPALGPILGSTLVDTTKTTRTTDLTDALAAKAAASTPTLSLGIDQAHLPPGTAGSVVRIETRESTTTPYLDITFDD
ncbi:hypothetical protein C5D36_00955 [Rathayibacter sp. AY1C6]|uniref:CBM96 family carbohydrate-binding protein n=1 Tax=Rathayibacter sp. AY1C6 TaxID=2080539 RepID=UPI000CE89010|nr:DNRLRE domain-containing protein [Rathayibacter sp. AY1C6]PPG18586.1 hypothetical protein C5D36_00955 [Rathayibacter sp. AY1C6]